MSSIAAQVDTVLERASIAPPKSTGIDRRSYLDLIAMILDAAAPWQDERGAIIDPVAGVEHGQTSCRFVAPGAVLLSAGRGEHLRDRILLGMDWCCRRLSSGQGQSPDFWMRELMTAYMHLPDVDPSRRARWAADLSSVDPESTYTAISRDGSRLYELHNYTVYAAAGEAMREVAGLGPPDDDGSIVWGRRFFEKYMPPQMTHFTEYGMYRDPGDPMTYDMTTRLQIAAALSVGFRSPSVARFEELIRRGALAQLLYVSPDGYAPYGGRSNQLHMQEAILTALCEIEARRYRTENPSLAGAFKRQGHLHTRSVLRWLVGMSPMRHVKNGFHPASQHGCESYAKYSVYSLFTASCLALAYQFADERVEEAACPSEIGGYVFDLKGAFHKVFAVCHGTQVEIDTAADLHYDATGLGRFHVAGVPLELGLSMPIPARPNYRVPCELLPETDLAIGPAWVIGDAWHTLAALNNGLDSATRVEHESEEDVRFEVIWTHASTGSRIRQRYQLTEGMLRIDADVRASQPVKRMRFFVPLLNTNGNVETKVDLLPDRATVRHPGGTYTVDFASTYHSRFASKVGNRNGIYTPLVLEVEGSTITLTLRMSNQRRRRRQRE
ncbi:MAG TPA: hypothetical protein VGN72_18275 [Tepidisphaeraceae bacterium]|jgi:hypothetical protein|nr:hypothetical protein [Tepidisphaeraceae bacterium]